MREVSKDERAYFKQLTSDGVDDNLNMKFKNLPIAPPALTIGEIESLSKNLQVKTSVSSLIYYTNNVLLLYPLKK